MSSSNASGSDQRKIFSSSEIKENFKKPLGNNEKKINKFYLFIFLALVLLLIIFTSERNNRKQIKSVYIPTDTINIENINKTQKIGLKTINVSATDIVQLRSILSYKSSSFLNSGAYTPVNLTVDLIKLNVSFDLDPTPSKIRKISLLWGPISSGCFQSCINALQKNPGSILMYSNKDNQYEYGIIAIAN